ncbi:hypothetical protein [Longicatena caecimuris]|uniref:hypothetical protein n=1 Tax=Longicatena caecimuris TaxID=1796635 RepID=UPI0018A914EE|nr:hypothetical protein [Longicatena caecimuris]
MNKYQEALDRMEETYYNLDNYLSAIKRFREDAETIRKLVKEHFEPQPYKFEELHEGMWVWHDKRKRCFRLTDAFIRVGTKYYRWLDISSGKLVQERFVEGQLFPLTKGMQC